MDYITVVPAYGRDYKSRAAIQADWDAGKDFQVAPSGQYINNRDAAEFAANATISGRFKRLTQITVLRKPGAPKPEPRKAQIGAPTGENGSALPSVAGLLADMAERQARAHHPSRPKAS